MANEISDFSCPPEILEEDILEAMKSIEGYIDITPSDFKEFYVKAYKHARERLLKGITAGNVMTKPAISVSEKENIVHAADVMAAANVSGLPVVNEKKEIKGVISEKDFLRELANDKVPSFMSVIAKCFNNKGCVALPIKKLTVREIMTTPPIIVDEKTVLFEILNLLRAKGINRLPVKDMDNRLVGIITRSDVIKTIFDTSCNY
jgi:CBS-domain-containing membrane protein